MLLRILRWFVSNYTLLLYFWIILVLFVIMMFLTRFINLFQNLNKLRRWLWIIKCAIRCIRLRLKITYVIWELFMALMLVWGIIFLDLTIDIKWRSTQRKSFTDLVHRNLLNISQDTFIRTTICLKNQRLLFINWALLFQRGLLLFVFLLIL